WLLNGHTCGKKPQWDVNGGVPSRAQRDSQSFRFRRSVTDENEPADGLRCTFPSGGILLLIRQACRPLLWLASHCRMIEAAGGIRAADSTPIRCGFSELALREPRA